MFVSFCTYELKKLTVQLPCHKTPEFHIAPCFSRTSILLDVAGAVSIEAAQGRNYRTCHFATKQNTWQPSQMAFRNMKLPCIIFTCILYSPSSDFVTDGGLFTSSSAFPSPPPRDLEFQTLMTSTSLSLPLPLELHSFFTFFPLDFFFLER